MQNKMMHINIAEQMIEPDLGEFFRDEQTGKIYIAKKDETEYFNKETGSNERNVTCLRICAFAKIGCGIIKCTAEMRRDGNNIVFKEIAPMEVAIYA
jgi:hypothetical protein